MPPPSSSFLHAMDLTTTKKRYNLQPLHIPTKHFTLPADKALAVYIQSPGSQFLFVGAVTVARSSAFTSLPWPDPGPTVTRGTMQLTALDVASLSAKIGVSI
ncbi:hypothetical protein ACFE04_014791 [Oxalis oulophora]